MPYPDHSDHPTKFVLAVVVTFGFVVGGLVVCGSLVVTGGTFAAVVGGILTVVV